MSTAKTELVIDLGGANPAILQALTYLSSLKEGASLHKLLDCRHPLGVYNLSISRICDKVQKCSAALEKYWLSGQSIEELRKFENLRDNAADYMELSLYAAAEHVDDIEFIANTFFRTSYQAAKSTAVRELKRSMKPLRDRISSLANAVKHAHGRLRFYSFDFRHDGRDFCLHGFFIEGFSKGALCPSPILHSTGEVIISITSFLWNILIFVASLSLELAKFLTAIDAVEIPKLSLIGSPPFREAVIALARLPLYSLDESHPFEAVKFVLETDKLASKELRSGIYGSMLNGWSKSSDGEVKKTALSYAGDGISDKLKLVDPKQLKLQHWDVNPR